MAASFASRLSGLKKINQPEEDGQLRLTLPPDTSDKSTYEPSTTFSNTRTSFRLLKGRIDRQQSTEKQEVAPPPQPAETRPLAVTQKLSLQDEPKSEFKLVLKDDPPAEDRKNPPEPPKVPLPKRILIAKEPAKEEPKKEEPKREEPKKEEPKKEEPPQQKLEKKESQRVVGVPQDRPIREEEAEESGPAEGENDLVLCPEGCGRSFNRKALEKHAKACKLVFMSKRKEFNSEAKRITSKQQANLVKQTKIKEKKQMGATRGKGFDRTKTGENWKAASQDFRAAIKAIKKQEKEDGEEEEKQVVMVQCEHCEKQFNEVFIDKHLENCQKKKEKEKKKTTKK